MHISIITASYNYENYIKNAIESVLAQTHKDWEMIIVDDGSSDNSVDIIKSYCEKDSRIKLLQHHDLQNHGLAKTVLLGLHNSCSEWIVFLESDDTLKEDYLEKKLAIIEQNPQVEFIFNDVHLFGDKERIRQYDKHFEIANSILESLTYPCCLLPYFENINLVPTFSCVMAKKDLLLSLEFNSPIKPFLDYYLWMQAAQKADFYYLPEKLTNWRMSKNSYISKVANASEHSQFLFQIKRKKITSNSKLNFWLFGLILFLNTAKKRIIRWHFKDKKICLFGKWFYYGK